MVKRDGYRFSVWQLLIAIFSVGCVTASATWLVARAHIFDELAQYEKSKDWNLPENLDALGQLCKKLTLTLDERNKLEQIYNELDEANKQNTLLSKKHGTLQKNLQIAEDTIKTLSERIERLEGDRFDVAENEAHYIIPGIFAVGLRDIQQYIGCADIQFGSQKYENVAAGTSLKETVDNVEYTVTLLKISERYCTFGVSKRSLQNKDD